MLEVGDRKFILYVPTRWLQCLPVIQRIVEQKIDKTKTDFINPLNVLLNDSIVVDRKTEEFIRELNNQDRILFFFSSEGLLSNMYPTVAQLSAAELHNLAMCAISVSREQRLSQLGEVDLDYHQAGAPYYLRR